MSAVDEPTQIDFFVSYTSTDRGWAEWIAWQLEKAGYHVLIQAWDFRPGQNFIEEMHRATQRGAKTLAVLSQAYLMSTLTQPEWQARLREDPTGKGRALLPVRVGECEPGGLLGPIVYVDLVDKDEAEARVRLLEGANDKRAIPTEPPVFPGTAASAGLAPKPAFPPVHEARQPVVPHTTAAGRADAERAAAAEHTATQEPLLIRWLGVLAGALRRPRPVAVAAALALLLAVIIVAIIVWPRPGADEPTFTQVGVSPRSLALGLGADNRLWIADPTQPEAWWLDASKSEVRTGQALLSPSARPMGVAVDAERKVAWVVDEKNDRAWQVDIPMRRSISWVQVGDGPQAVAVAEDVVWVANRDGTLSRIDARSGQLVGQKIRLGGRLSGIAAGAGAVWVISTKGNVVWRIDADAPSRMREYGSQGPRSIAVGQGAAWVANRGGTVSRIDGEGEPKVIDVGDELCGISAGEGGVWVSAPGDDRVWRIDPDRNETSGDPVEVEDAPCAVAAGNGSIWVANRGDSSISRIEP